MLEISDSEFRKIVSWAIDSLPDYITSNLKNVAIVVEAEPNAEQRKRLHLVKGALLFGLYEGVPQTSRYRYSLALPDKITIFKNPTLSICHDIDDLKRQVKRTVWHEIAHHYGLDHDRIGKLLDKSS
jgi:predicted Zn-dependent protease with MMP-like domain